MKKLLISILFVLAGLFVVDRLGGMAMWWVCQHTHDVSGPKSSIWQVMFMRMSY